MPTIGHRLLPPAVRRRLCRAASSFGAGQRLLQVIDCHAAGEPARVVVGGLPHVAGESLSEKRTTFMRDFDHYRKLLLLEPRGYPCQNADFIVPSTREDAAYGVVRGSVAAYTLPRTTAPATWTSARYIFV